MISGKRLGFVLVASSLGSIACGPRFDAEAEVRDHRVHIQVRKLQPGDEVELPGFDEAVGTVEHGYARIEIPAERMGAGKHEIEIEVTRGDRKKTQKISVDVPAAALKPFLRISGCAALEEGQYGNGSAKLKSSALRPGTSQQHCRLQPNGALELTLQANTDAKVKLGEQLAKLDGGTGTAMLSVQPLLHRLSLGSVSNAKASGELPLEVQATSTRDGSTQTFAIQLEVELNAIRNALFDSVLEMDGGKPATWPRSAHTGKPRGAVLAAKRHPARVDGKDQTVMHPAFTRMLVAGEDSKLDQIDLFAVATPSDVTGRKPCTGYTTIAGSGSVRNRGFVMGFDVKVYDHSGKQVAAKSFAKPKDPRCPSSLSGTRGKTTILVWAPAEKDVESWLATLVR